jgi:hypothetical protein
MKDEDLLNRFTYHPPKQERGPDFVALRDMAHKFASLINCSCPEGREKSLAVTKVEEAVMWANAAIVREVPECEKSTE